jgi:alpha-1,2-mannosyltransferase
MGDLIIYRTSSLALLHGHGLYAVVGSRNHLHFTYPPFAALVLLPLAVVWLPVAKLVISLLTLVGLAYCVRVVMRRLDDEGTLAWPTGVLPIALAASIWLEPVRATVSFGQINLLLMAMVVADVLAIRDEGRSGFLIGIAAAVKLTPLAFIPYLFAIGRRRAAANAIAAFLGCGLVGLVFAPHASRSFWGDHLFLQARRVGVVENASNQSIRGILARLLSTPDVPTWWVAVAVVGFAAGLAAAVHLYRAGRPVWSLTAMAVTTLIVSPISWSHHWVWCVLMLLTVGDLIRRTQRWPIAILGAIALVPFAAALIFWAPHVGHEELTDTPLQQVLSATYVLAGALLVATLTVVSLRPQRIDTAS